MDEQAKIPKGRISRTAKVGQVGASHMARSATNKMGKAFRSPEAQISADNEQLLKTARQLVQQLSHMKGAAMKFGQVLSTVDIPTADEATRKEFKRIMSQLQDESFHVSWQDMEKVICRELGGKLSDHFQTFNQDAVAAASIGQVYRATLPTGEEVAVKVQYPGVAYAVETDLRNMKMLTPLIRKIAPNLDVKALLQELAERISEELDYELEAQHQRRIARLYRRHPYAQVPAVHTDLSTKSVLVTEWVDGQPFVALQELPQQERNRCGEIIFRFYYDLLYRSNICCGDPHPGNILLADDGRVCFLDFGMIKMVEPTYMLGEQQLGRSIFQQDAAAVYDTMQHMGFLKDGEHFEPQELLALLQVSYSMFDEHRLTTDAILHSNLQMHDPRSPHAKVMHRQQLPVEGLLVRRLEDLLWSVLASLDIELDWQALFGEYYLRTAPQTTIGQETTTFWQQQHKPVIGG